MPDPIKAKHFEPNTFVYASAQMKRVIRERDDNLILAHEFKAENARLRDVLKDVLDLFSADLYRKGGEVDKLIGRLEATIKERRE